MEPSNAHHRIPALDGVRGIATLTVLFCHFLFEDLYHDRWWWAVAHAGWLGVDLFFVLSGFLITGILLQKRNKPGYFSDFYRRRILRIFPLYYFSLLLSVFAILVIDQQPHRLYTGYDSLAWYFAFIPNVALALKNDWLWQTNWVGLSHLWSLAVEEQFYMVWPLVVFLLPRKPLLFTCVAIIAMSAWIRMETDVVFGQKWSIASYVLPYCRMDGLAAGSLLAILRRYGWLTHKGLQRDLGRDFTFAAFMFVFYMLVAGNSHWRGTWVALMFFGMVYFALDQKGLIKKLCELPFLMHIGTYSYGMYIFHQMFRVVFEKIFRQPLVALELPEVMVQVLYLLLAGLTTYGLARLSFKYIEKPFLDMK